MNKDQAQRIIRDTFENKFERNRFTRFIVELLNLKSLAVSDPGVTFNTNQVPNAYQQFISSFGKIADYKIGEHKLDVLVIRLKKETSIERARTMQRNFIAWYLRGDCDGEMKEAALAAFVSPDEEDWRFSLIKMDYSLGEDKKGRIKISEEFTSAKRWSFLVGSNEKSHTAQSQLIDILAKDEINPTLAQLEESFNIETVTKEFFKKYWELFFRTKETLDKILEEGSKIKSDFETKNINTVDFSKKLLGQIVFLYFLQKKGWFGVARDADWGTGPKNFLRELFDRKHGKYKNFYNDILEPLFYEALRNDRSYDDDYYRLFNCKIPFLNGGLFDPINNYDWVHTDINLPDDLFSNEIITKERDKGTGILDIFDRYNFTVKEDEPLEKEVAVDPEMLGKVFENLLEVKDRKSKGTYYTPREIVHYMCRQSLINYLATEMEEKVSKDDIEKLIKYGEQFGENNADLIDSLKDIPESIVKNAKLIDEKLTDIRICDPAVGSGAFLVGMMGEIVRSRNVLSNYIKDSGRTIYNFKRDCIENSLYGVDIDPGAVEITKLRLWLSLVVDEEDIKRIKPLPNLDYKIMQGNSLIELLSGEFLANSIDRKRTELVNKLKKSKDELFNVTAPSQKELKRQEIDGLIKELFEHDRTLIIDDLRQKIRGIQNQGRLFKDAKFEAEDKKRIEEIEDKIKEFQKIKIPGPSEHFEWHINFSEIFQEKAGFDVVIANPPYVGEKGHKDIFREMKHGNLAKFYQRKMDLFYFFLHLALNLGKKVSNITFITTNYYLTATGAKKLRQDFKERAIIKNLMNFNELKIFESALGQHNMITILEKGQDKNAIAKTCITQRQGITNSEILHQILSENDEKTHYYKIIQKDLYDGDQAYIRGTEASQVLGNSTKKILDKVKLQGVQLTTICNVNQGLRTGADKVSPRHIREYNLNNIKCNEGIFIISQKEYRTLKLTQFEQEKIEPLFKNSDIRQYYTKIKSDFFLVDIFWPNDRNLSTEKIPNLIQHLAKYKKILINRKENANGIDKAIAKGLWWFASVRRRLNFDIKKIVSPQRSKSNVFGYNETPWYASADVYFITEKDKSILLKYVLALLNSKLYYLWLYHRGKRKGETLELYQKPLSEIPIKKISLEAQKFFIYLVDKILAITKGDDYLNNSAKQSIVEEYKNQIDQLVYKLYDLTKEEVKIIEEEK